MNLEIPKKFSPLINQAQQVAREVFRPISRKYDRAEHEYPKELDLFASIMDGMNDGAADGGTGAGKLARSESNGGGGNRNGTNMKTVLGLTELCWGDVGLAYYGNDLTLRAAYSLSDTERVNRDGAGVETFASDGRSERVSLRGEYRLLGGLALAFGGDHEWTEFETSFDAAAETEISGAYAQLGWVMGRLAAHGGARVDDHEQFGTHVSFGGDVSYGFGSDWRVRASVGEGFKAPTLYQLLSFYGNTELEPEESTSYDLGIEKGQRGSGLHLALTGFRRDSDNLIGFGFTPERPFGIYLNTARARAQGIEAEAGFDLARGLRLSGIYSYVDAEDRTTDLDLARRPDHFGTIYADWTSDFGLGLGADLRIVGPSWDNAANTTRLDGYELLDVRASFGIGDHLELFGRVENVFDTDYQTVAGYGTAGRSVFGGIRATM